MIYKSIKQLVSYARRKGLIEQDDEVFMTNRLLEMLKLDEYHDTGECFLDEDLETTLRTLCDYAVKQGFIEEGTVSRDLFDTKLMGLFVKRPSEVIHAFWERYKQSPESATDYFYQLCMDSDYIRRYRIARDLHWQVPSDFGDIEISINLSKPEKDPKAIAAAKLAKQSGYPKCLLCRENEGYAGRLDTPARQNHRIIPLSINGQAWYFQYSPYVYYNEHCIVFNAKHTPMRIDSDTFRKLLSFVEQFPHYFVGSNADLPIVGGSILSHDHFQGGRFEFPMAKAPIEKALHFDGFDDVEAGILHWPLSTIRLKSKSTESLCRLADKILSAWRAYTDEAAFIFAETNGEKHNTITPIARFQDGHYELDLVLRNNITTKEHPLGVYHPHEELHHIKKENIGLIEVMGLAILPARLKEELALVADGLLEGRDLLADERTAHHARWANEVASRHKLTKETIDNVLQQEVGKVFVKVLQQAGVYKCTEEGRQAFVRFANSI